MLLSFFNNLSRHRCASYARLRGTRVPVHSIAAMLEQGSTEADILKGYPRLTAQMVRLAPVFAQAYPIRGRPRSQPWPDRPPVQRTRERLA